MYLLFIIIVLFILSFLYVDFETFKGYYPTIQIFIIFNLLYNFIFYQHTLWSYAPETPWLNHTFLEIIYSFIIIPLMIIVYLRFFPSGWKGAIYIVVWIFAFWLIEFDFNHRGKFHYDNNWNIWWSLGFNFIMFPFLRLHSKRPFLAILLSIPIIFILLCFFHPLFKELK